MGWGVPGWIDHLVVLSVSRHAEIGDHRRAGFTNSAYGVSKLGFYKATLILADQMASDPRHILINCVSRPTLLASSLSSIAGTLIPGHVDGMLGDLSVISNPNLEGHGEVGVVQVPLQPGSASLQLLPSQSLMKVRTSNSGMCYHARRSRC